MGVDIRDSVEALARTRLDLDVVYFDGVNIPLGAESVDFIYSSQVFEHVRHPEPLLREMRRVLQPSGTVAVNVKPAAISLQVLLELHAMGFSADC